MNQRTQLTRLLKRDENLCGIHIGGCGHNIRNRADATVDHIFTRSFFKDREMDIKPQYYNKDWNCQPMHRECNNIRGGQIAGFPLFVCKCHWLKIEKMIKGYMLLACYKKWGFSYQVSSEKHNFVSCNPSWGRIFSIWTMGAVGPGKSGITGKGHLGHAFPKISPNEVPEFNRLEIERVKGHPSGTITKFNLRMDTIPMQVHFRRGE